MMVASAIQNTAVLVVIPLLLAAISHARPRDFGLASPRRQTGWHLLQGVVAWPLATPLVYGMMIVAVAIWGKQNHPLESAIQAEGIGRMTGIFFLAGAILAPAAEELIFRGVLLGWLTSLIFRASAVEPVVVLDSERPGGGSVSADPLALDHVPPAITPDQLPDAEFSSGPAPHEVLEPTPLESGMISPPLTSETTARMALANVVVSILFAGLHYSVWPTPVPIFFLSLVLGLLYQRTGSLLAPVALHMTFNGVSTLLMLVTVGVGPEIAPTSAPTAPTPIPAPVPHPITPPVNSAGEVGLVGESWRIWEITARPG